MAFTTFRDVCLDDPELQYGCVAAPDSSLARCCPTVIAVSGEEQRHVSSFFKAWRAESRGWQVLVPLRNEGYAWPYLFEPGGVEAVVRLLKSITEGSTTLPYAIEGGRVHLIGSSNGGAAVLAAACLAPHLVASLTLVTGFIPDIVTDLSPLRHIGHIRLYAGSEDHLGHQIALTHLRDSLFELGIDADLRIIPGAGHGSIGRSLDLDEFWFELELARTSLALPADKDIRHDEEASFYDEVPLGEKELEAARHAQRPGLGAAALKAVSGLIETCSSAITFGCGERFYEHCQQSRAERVSASFEDVSAACAETVTPKRWCAL